MFHRIQTGNEKTKPMEFHKWIQYHCGRNCDEPKGVMDSIMLQLLEAAWEEGYEYAVEEMKPTGEE